MALPAILEEMRRPVEVALEGILEISTAPKALREAMAWSLLDGGKRLRPLLVLATRRLFLDGLDAMPAACALEMIHTYSLIHDDLPAMDDDDLRRGRPTCHRRFGEAMAILAGDALLTEAFLVLARAYGGQDDETGISVIAEIARAAGPAGMVGGQVLDIEATGKDLSMAELEELHRCKTGALIRAAVRVGALLGRAEPPVLHRLTRCAERLGLAFQVVDDVLDATSTAEVLGKTPGKDLAQGKTTMVTLLGIEGARRKAASLVDEALRDLDDFDSRADPLRAIAALFVQRAS